MQAQASSQEKRHIVWVSPLILDVHLHKTTQIEILRALGKRGHAVSLIASYSSEKSSSEFEDLNVISFPLKYVPLFSSVVYVLGLLLYLPFLFMRLKPDFVIIEPSAIPIISLVPMILVPKRARKKPKIVLDIRSTPVHVFGIRGYLDMMLFGAAIHTAKKFFQGITVITDLMKKEVCEEYNLDPGFVGVWTSGVSLATFEPQEYSGLAIRNTFNLEDKFIIFCHGGFDKLRGIIETLNAVKMLKNGYKDVFLFLLGEADFPLKDLIQELDVQNIVTFHESVSYKEVPKYIAMCDVSIVPLPNLPDWRHQCPLNLLEYLAMRKVVIATDIPANREILGGSQCGIYASSGDPNEIANAIVYALKSRKMLEKWGALGRSIVERKYSWEKVAEKLETYLFSL